MKRFSAAVLAATVGMLGCDGSVASPDGTSGLALTVTAAQVSADQGRLYIEGPTNRTLTLSPGDRSEIDLPVGSYSVALEGLNTGTVVGFFERTNVTVSDGRQTTLTITLQPFAANAPSAAATAQSGVPVTVTWAGVSGAVTYDVEASASPTFATLIGQQSVAGTSTEFTIHQSGPVYFRVRPRTRFDGAGAFSEPSTATQIGQPPAIDFYDVFFVPISQACGENFRDFRTDEVVGYSDGDGDMDPARTFMEPAGGTAMAIESQWRPDGGTVWNSFGYDKGWTPLGGATGNLGDLGANGSTCWNFDADPPPDYFDFRVRVQDAGGLWSDWFEQRLYLPASVVVSPPGDESVFVMNPGDTQPFSAVALDINGLPVEGDAVNWSSYVGQPHATIDALGNFTVDAATDGGLDWVIARAGYVNGVVPVQAGFVDGGWFSPGWSLPGIALPDEGTFTFQVRVFEGREYTFFSTADGSGASTGDLDVYIRFGTAPTLTEFDDSSTNPGLDDSITWTAPADGVMWVLVHAFNPVTGGLFGIGGDRAPPRVLEALPAPATRSPHTMWLSDEEATRAEPMWLPPTSATGPSVRVVPSGRR